ncbi:Eukaryotic translation initiation factor 2D [Fasciola gigantica]|uniref:Eukaryotic translation initiation factor 2D n=1 Tax=Fasciola gigantica TaxID=46835 RepID=A0A504YTA7_FASGI|nr:Eukaryotic translation initiation factor 2D [Fasciola gigantica]
MFLKPISIKSNNKIKASERRQLVENFRSQYAVDLGRINTLFDTNDVFRVRLSTNCSKIVTVYKFAGEPLLLEFEKQLIPTGTSSNHVFVSFSSLKKIAVRFLWSFVDLLPHFVTHEEVVPKLMSGADLMIPGLVLDRQLTAASFGGIKQGVLCAISTVSNRAPVAVGHTAMSAYDMFMSAGRGKAVIVFHVLGDQICSLGSPLTRPLLDFAESSADDDGMASTQPDTNPCTPEESVHVIANEATVFQSSNRNDPASREGYDVLLRNFFLLALKSVQDNQLPMPVNVFYANHVLAHKPSSCDFDIKKTSYKKVGVFLKAMQDDGLLLLDEPKPGVLLIKALSRDHPEAENVQPLVNEPACVDETKSSSQWPDGYPGPPILEEVRVLSGASVMAIFKNFGYRPGDCISQREVHRHLIEYIHQRQLQRKDDPSMIQLNELLMAACDPNTFKEASESTLAKPVFLLNLAVIESTILKRLAVCHRLRFPNNRCPPVLWRKKSTPFIHLYSATKNGKNLTRVANLDTFRIDPEVFAKRIQLLLACSATQIDDPQYPESVVIQAQGTHLVAISKLLTDSYGIPKQMIRGYTEPPKKKKK